MQKTVLAIRRTLFTRTSLALFVFHFSLFTFHFSSAQDNSEKLSRYEDTLKVLSDSIVLSHNATVRQNSSLTFIKTLVRALKVEGSYDYPFDSLKRVVVMDAPDNKFRIFNWGLVMPDETYRFYGAIQMHDKEKLTIYPLYDFSQKIVKADTITSSEKWFGALYYKIIQKKKYYYLFGWNGNTLESNKKVIDVLWFDKKKKPRFGAAQFVWENKSGKKKTQNRVVVEYREEASITVNYDKDMNMIIYDHLVPPNDKATGMYSLYIPDGSYEGFKYKGGKWVHVDNVWTSTQTTPFPKPIDFDKETLSKPRGKKSN